MSKNYVKVLQDGTEVTTLSKPSFGYIRDAEYAGDNPDVYIGGQFYPTSGGGIGIKPALGTAYVDQPTYLPNVVEVANGVPIYVQEFEVPDLVRESIHVNKLTVIDGFDLGQKWVDVKANRTFGITYLNDTGKPISLGVVSSNSISSKGLKVLVDGFQIFQIYGQDGQNRVESVYAEIPHNSTYTVVDIGVNTVNTWMELR